MSEQTSFCFWGNCQARTLSSVARQYGFPAEYMLVCSTDMGSTYGIKAAKEYLMSFLPESVVQYLLSAGILRINPSRKEIAQIEADVFVYTLFHEFNDCYIHKEKEFIIQFNYSEEIDENVKSTLFEKLASDFNLIKVDHEDYFERLYKLIKENCRLFPRSKHVVVARIKNSDVSNRASSFLVGWHLLQNEADAFYKRLEQLGVIVTDISLPLKKYFNQFGIQQGFPVKINKKLDQGNYSFSTYLDIEHPRKEYWEFVFCTLMNIEQERSIDESDEATGLRNALIQSIRERDTVSFTSLLESLSPADVDNEVEVLEAAVYVIGEDIYRAVRKVLVRRIKLLESERSLLKEKMQNLLSICSNEDVFDELPQNDAIALWGAGGRCKALIEELRNKLDIRCIFDSDPQKHGKFLSGIPIVNPELWQKDEELKVIVVTTTYYVEVVRSVTEYDTLAGVRLIGSKIFLDRLMAQQKAILV